MALWEVISPRRRLQTSKAIRWANNLGLVVVNSLVLRVAFPAAALGMALFAGEQGWGLFNYIEAPFWLAVVLSVLVLDFFIWLQHVMVHAVPLLWRLHRVHHADLDFDVTTGARFHTLEILLSMLIKFAVIILLGPPLVAVVIFEVLLNATSMFNHGNVRIPVRLDRLLRLVVVTPDMHRVHHSVEDDETNSNFGFNLPWWDRLFGTYRAQPRAGHEAMRIGIRTFRADRWCSWLPGILTIPFVGKVQDYAINRRQWEQTHEP
jgi:sterol desaturase/sphingolipid hydroxylase (fatty acid hydroxylase superfamily)